jgi:RND family efflux transporter MFP subunit
MMLISASRRTTLAVPVALFVSAFLAGLFAGCGGGAHADTTPAEKTREAPPLKAVVLTVEPAPWPAVVRTQGSLIADEVSIVGAKVGGRVNEVNFDLGDAVKAGTVLATLDQDDFVLQVSLAEAQLLQARAALGLRPSDPVESLNPENAPPVREARALWEEARAKISRVRQLQSLARNTVTQDEYDQAVAAEGAAEARYAAAMNAVREKIALISVRASELNVSRQHLADTILQAPFDGLIQERHVAHGSFLQMGDPIATLVRTHVLRYRGAMPERYAHRLAMGQEVHLKMEGIPEKRVAKITRISPTVEETSRSLVFEAQVDNRDGSLRTGLFAEGEVIVDPAAQSLIVPRAAILEFAGAEKVWKLVDSMAKEQIVQTGRHTDDVIEILGGLKTGDVILADALQGRMARVEPIAAEPSPQESPVSTTAAPPPADESGTQFTSDHAVSR